MKYERRFKVLVCAPAFDADDLESQRRAPIIEAIGRIGFTVVKAREFDDAELAIRTDSAIGCVLVDRGKRGPQGKMAALLQFIRGRGLKTEIQGLYRETGSDGSVRFYTYVAREP